MSITPKNSAMRTITLAYPITINGQILNTISLRRPTVRDVMASKAKATNADQELTMLAALSQPMLTVDQLLDLDLEDYQRLQQQLAAILTANALAQPAQTAQSTQRAN